MKKTITPAELNKLFWDTHRSHPMYDYYMQRRRDTRRQLANLERKLTALQEEVKAELLKEYEVKYDGQTANS